MTTLEDLYDYYCRRCDCKPNSGLQRQLREAFAAAEAERDAFTSELLYGPSAAAKAKKALIVPSPPSSKPAAMAATTEAVVTTIAAAAGDNDDEKKQQQQKAKAAKELALLDPTYARNNNPHLTEIDLSTNYVGPKGVEPVLLLVKGLSSVRTLRLAHNMLTHEALLLIRDHLCAPRPHPTLATIDLRGNLLHNGSAALLIEIVESNPHITSLLLEGNDGLTPAERARVQTFVDANVRAAAAEAAEAAAEDAIAAKARANRPLYLAHKAALTGLTLTLEQSGGHFHYATWRRNPQFSFRVSHTCAVAFTMRIAEPIVSTRQYGFAVVRNGRNVSFGGVLRVIDVVSKEALAEEEAAERGGGGSVDAVEAILGPKASSNNNSSVNRNVIIAESPLHERRAHVELTLESNCGAADSPYTIIAYDFAPGRECPTSFSIEAEIIDADFASDSNAFVRLEPLRPEHDWSQAEVEGHWGAAEGMGLSTILSSSAVSSKPLETAMGPLPFASWRDNESFRVTIAAEQPTHAEEGVRNTVVRDVLAVEAAALKAASAADSGAEPSSPLQRRRNTNKSPATAAVQQGEAIAKALREAMGHRSAAAANAVNANSKKKDGDDEAAIHKDAMDGQKGASAVPFIDAPAAPPGRAPAPLRLAKSLAAGLVTVYIVLTKSNDSDANDSTEIGFYVVTPDRRGRLPMRIVAQSADNADGSDSSPNAIGGSAMGCTRTGLPTMPARPALATDGALLAYCPHARRTSVTLAVEVPAGEMDFFVVPTAARPSPSSAFAKASSSSAPFTLQFFATAAISVARYAPNASPRWCAEWAAGAPPLIARLPFGPSTSGGGRQGNATSWIHNNAIEFFNDGPLSSSTPSTGAVAVAANSDNARGGSSNSGIDLCVSVEPTAAAYCPRKKGPTTTTTAAAGDADDADEDELVEVAVMLVALRRCDTAAEAILCAPGGGGASAANVRALDTALVAATSAGKRSATSLQHQLLILAHSPFVSASAVYGGGGATKQKKGSKHGTTAGFITDAEAAAASSFPTAAVTPHSPPIPSVSSASAPQQRFEATLSVTDLPPGRYFIVPCTRRGGQVGFDAIVRCFSSSSAHSAGNGIGGMCSSYPSSSSLRCVARFTGAVRPLGDWARDQQMLDFAEETALRRSVASGVLPPSAADAADAASKVAGASTTATKAKANLSVTSSTTTTEKELFTDRDFPPMPSSLWMDAAHPYPNAPPVEPLWRRASEIALKQQERYLLNVADPMAAEEEAAEEAAAKAKTRSEEGESEEDSEAKAAEAKLQRQRRRLQDRSDLQRLLARRGACLGSIAAIATGGAVTSTDTAADRLRRDLVRLAAATEAKQSEGDSSSPLLPLLPSPLFFGGRAFASHGHRAVPAPYSGCLAAHTNLGSEWYLSALACIITRPTTFGARVLGGNCANNSTSSEDSSSVASLGGGGLGYDPITGMAAFSFFINGKWTRVVVDDRLPVDAAGELCFAASVADGDFLAPLVEKAYAKAHRCYAALGADRGAVRRRIVAVLPACEENGDAATATTATMRPRPPAAAASDSSSSSSGPLPLVLADQSGTIDKSTAGAHFRRTVLARSSAAAGGGGKSSSTLDDAMVLSTSDGATFGAPRVPTAPVLENDGAAFGIDIEAAHDAAAMRERRRRERLLSSSSTAGVSPTSPSSPFYASSGVVGGIRYGEPPIALLHQALTDFTGATVRVYDITTSVASGVVGGGAVSATAARGLASSASLPTTAHHRSSPPPNLSSVHQSPAHVGNNTTDSAAYYAAGLLPPHIAETISSSLYLCEAYAMDRLELAWQTVLTSVFDPERLIAGALVAGAQGWEQRKHCGLQYNCLYPIVDAREVDGVRLVKVFSNWGSPNVVVAASGAGADRERHHNTLWWKGKYRWGAADGGATNGNGKDDSGNTEEEEGWTERLKTAVGYDASHSKTTFWMSIGEVAYYFSHLFEASYDSAAVGGAASSSSATSSSSAAAAAAPQWVEGAYGPDHVGGSFRSASWVNNDQYALRITDVAPTNQRLSGRGGADAAKVGAVDIHAGDTISVTVGIHQPNSRATMTRAREARYTYADAPVGLAVVRTTDDTRRLARVGPADIVTTLFPAAVRDRYHTFTIPRGLLSTSTASTASSAPSKFILMPFVSVSGANDDEVRWAAAHSLARDEGRRGGEGGNPFSPRRATHYMLSVSSRDAPCNLSKILDDTRTVVEGAWVAGVGVGSSSSSPAEGTAAVSPNGITNKKKSKSNIVAAAPTTAARLGTAGGPPSVGTWRNNPQFLLYPSLDGNITITLRQHCGDGGDGSTTKHVGFVVVDGSASHLTRLTHLEGQIYNASADTRIIPNKIVMDVPHCNDFAVSGTVALQGMQTRRGRPYHIVPSCLEHGGPAGEGAFSLEATAAGGNTVRITEVPPERDWRVVTISESFRFAAGNTGGSAQYSTWRNNPQYLLRLPFEHAGRLLVSITNKRKGDTEPIGCLLFASDAFASATPSASASSSSPLVVPSECRKILLSNTLCAPIEPRLVEDRRASVAAGAADPHAEGPHTASLLGPSFDMYSLLNAPTAVSLLEEERLRGITAGPNAAAAAARRRCQQQQRAGNGNASSSASSSPPAPPLLDVLADTGAYPHHAEVFYDVALSSAADSLILMPYTATPMAECDVEITIMATVPIEVSPVEEYCVAVAEGSWAPGISAGGARAVAVAAEDSNEAVSKRVCSAPPLPISGMWINNPFFALNLLGGAMHGRPTRLFIVMLMYPDGPERPAMRRVGKGKVVVPPTTATVPSLTTMLELTAAFGGEGAEEGAMETATSAFISSTSASASALARAVASAGSSGFGSSHSRLPAAFGANMALVASSKRATLTTASAELTTTSAASAASNNAEEKESAREKRLRASNALLHNTHTSVAARASFGFDIVRGDSRYSPLCSSRHTHEGEAAVLIEALAPCGETQLPYYIVPHTRAAGIGGHFKLIVYSDLPVQVEAHAKPKRYW